MNHHRCFWSPIVRIFGIALAIGCTAAFPGVSLAWTGKPLAYVTEYDKNDVLVVDTGDEQLVGKFATPKGPLAAVVASDGARIYIASRFTSSVSVVQVVGKNYTALGSIPLDGINAFALAPDGKRLYVVEAGNQIDVIDTESLSVIKSFDETEAPIAIAVAPDGKRYFIGNGRSNDIYSFSTADDSVEKRADITSIDPLFELTSFTVAPDSSRLYVLGGSSIYVIDTATMTVIATKTLSPGLAAAAVMPDGKTMYVANVFTNYVYVLNTATLGLLKAIAVSSPGILRLTPDAKQLYAADGNTVTVIDTTTNDVTLTWPGFAGITSIAMIPPKPAVPTPVDSVPAPRRPGTIRITPIQPTTAPQ